MKNAQDRDTGGEILRLVLQKMASQPASFTPLTYAVWYEYATGINGALSDAINKRLESNDKFDDKSIEKLYAQFIFESSTDVQEMLRDNIKQLLEKIAGSTADTDKQAIDFGSSLRTYSDALKGEIDAPKLISLVNQMAGDTEQMRSSMQQLQTQLQESKQQVEKLSSELKSARGEASTDPLTTVLNRRGFEALAQTIFAEQASVDKGVCLLVLDIDHFKQINDKHGHLFGDKVICGIANALKAKVKGGDAIARLGGEEFAVLLPETNVQGAYVVAEQIRKTIEMAKIIRHDSHEPIGGITVSIGIASYITGYSLEHLIDQADKALYMAKQSGRNRTIVFNSPMAQ